MEKEFKVELGFVQRRLPWLIAGAVFVAYLVTMSHAATFGGLSVLAQVSGWDWRPSVTAPLHMILTLPIRWLPAGAQLLALNLLAGILGALTVAVLARSVAILPHDRTREQRAFERSDYSFLSIPAAWLPPVLAALVCGFQLTFWENAIVATGEALDILIFAWLVLMLLEYRLDENQSRLTRFALVYGLSITNNYAMIGFFPAFLVALFWIQWPAVLNWKLLGRMAAFGLAGLLLYFVMPIVGSATTDFTFWEFLRGNWSYQKAHLLGMPRYIILLISMTSVVPVFFMGIRWPAQFGDISAAGNALTNLMMFVIHGIFFLAGLYVAFDPPFSPRSLSSGQFSLLPFYYLGALAIGYCAGYLLLVFGAKQSMMTWKKPSRVRLFTGMVIVVLVWVAAAAVPAGLIYQNLPKIRANSGQELSRLAAVAARALPDHPSMVVSDDLPRLYAVQLELQKIKPGHQHMLVDGSQFDSIAYQRYLQRKHPARWPQVPLDGPTGQALNADGQMFFFNQVARSNEVYYLHPSFGLFFEYYYARPQGPVYRLQPYPTNAISGPTLTRAEVQEQEKFWNQLTTTELAPLLKNMARANAKYEASKFLEPPQGIEAYVASAYSRTLTDLGVEAQRASELRAASNFFTLALQFNGGNANAFMNLDFNRHLQSGGPGAPAPSEGMIKRMAPYGGNWNMILGLNGPVEEPTACYLLAQVFDRGNLNRQSAQMLARTSYYEPTNTSCLISLINQCVRIPLPDRALALIAELRAKPSTTLTPQDQLELIRTEAWSHAMKNDLATAMKLLANAQEKYPKDPVPFAAQAQIYLRTGQGSNALATLERQLQLQPQEYSALVTYANLLMQANNPKGAITYLDRALAARPQDPAALLNRAIASLYSEPPRLDEAIRDYIVLESILPRDTYNIRFGLAEAYRLKKNRKEALRYYREYLKVAPKTLPERRAVLDRIKELEASPN